MRSRRWLLAACLLPLACGSDGGMLPAAASPAKGKGTGCPTIDARGLPRASACTLGAVE